MSKQSSKKRESNYVTTVRSEACPAIAANIFRRTSQDGHTYLDYEISRSWKTASREGYSTRFYARNRDGIKEVADLASDWIEQNPQAADGLPERSLNGRRRTSENTSPAVE